MKQAILLSGPEISALRRGKHLEVSLGNEILLLMGEKDSKYGKKLASLRKARAAKKGRKK